MNFVYLFKRSQPHNFLNKWKTGMDKAKFNKRINQHKVVLVDFGATWCRPCRAMEPIIDDVTKRFRGMAYIFSIDIDSHHDLATEFMVQSIPTCILFNDGKEVKRFVGLQEKESLVSSLSELLSRTA
jgi:thioredoxin 1